MREDAGSFVKDWIAKNITPQSQRDYFHRPEQAIGAFHEAAGDAGYSENEIYKAVGSVSDLIIKAMARTE